jgi:hypothetical protein
MKLKKAVLGLNERTYNGYVQCDADGVPVKWNAWVAPMFAYRDAVQILTDALGEDVLSVKASWIDNRVVIEVEDADTTFEITSMRCQTIDGEAVEVYSVGAFEWVWFLKEDSNA